MRLCVLDSCRSFHVWGAWVGSNVYMEKHSRTRSVDSVSNWIREEML